MGNREAGTRSEPWSWLDSDLLPLLSLGLVLIVALSVFFITDALAHRRQTLESVLAEERQYAHSIAGHINSLTLLADHMVADISTEAEYRLEGAMSEATPLSPGLVDGRIIRQVLVFKADGSLWASYPARQDTIDCSACRSFQTLRDVSHNSLLGAYFTDIPRTTAGIGLARRIEGTNGSFGGIVVAFFDLDAVVEDLGKEPQLVVLFTAADGPVATYRSAPEAGNRQFPPLAEFHLDKGVASGLLSAELIAAVEPLSTPPLWVGVAASRSAIDQKTTQDFLIAAALCAGTILAVGTFWAVAGTQIRRRRRAERALTLTLEDLEHRVADRTSALQREIEERNAAEVALRASEGRFLHFMENIPVGAHITDGEGRFVFLNRKLATWLDLDPTLAVGKACRDLLPTELADQWEALDQFARSTNRVETRELIFYGRQRESIWLADRFWLNIDADSHLLGGLVTDITAHRAAEKELHHAQRMEALGQLTSGLTHDFNNLLTIILGNLEIAEDLTQAHDAVRQHVREARWAAQRGAHLTDRLLAMSRSGSSKAEPTDVVAIVQSMAELLGRTLGKEIETTIATPPGPVMAMAKPDRLENAILNLCLNARDAMPRGGTLRIRVAADGAAPPIDGATTTSHVSISVTDSGIGMVPEVIAQACDPFFTTKSTGKGSGLGLSMVRSFVDEMDGAMAIDSEPERGTTVRLYFRRTNVAAPLQVEAPVAAVPDGSPATVLVVDDEPEVRRLAVDILRKAAYHVYAAADAAEALAVLERTAVDLLVSDIVMPGGMNGVTLAAEVRRRWPSMVILLTSGHPAEAAEHLPLLRKPFDRHGLAQAVRRLLHDHETEMAAAKL